jgi:aminoglycoside phosphotransferase (APT) family kinase protein
MDIATRLPDLRAALARRGLPAGPGAAAPQLEPLATTGLAHDHVRIAGTGLLCRVPKQSQLALDAEANLAYQAACFQRAGPSGHVPRLHAVLPPGEGLPLGALVVEEIAGRPPALPGDLPAIAEALAAIHRLPLPEPAARPPLKDQSDPIGETLAEVRRQGEHLPRAGLAPEALAAVREELDWAEALAARPRAMPVALISFDAHPGNFLIDPSGRAVLVDLEKARYGGPGFDLAHATLYTSTTWDVATRAVLTPEQTAEAYARWLAAVPAGLGEAARPWLLPLRRIMWLWSVTWCAKWRVESRAARKAAAAGGSAEDWSAELSGADLVAHVAGRVADYLDPETIARVRGDWLGRHGLTAMAAGDGGLP